MKQSLIVVLLLLSMLLHPHDKPVQQRELNILRASSHLGTFFLTFDAHTDSRNLDYVLDTLAAHGVRATFFITGTFIQKYPELTRTLAASPHIVGNHTYTHAQFRTAEALRQELINTEELYYKTTGQSMTRVWRAPYLQHLGKGWLLAAAAAIGYQHVDAGLFARDWVDRGHPHYLANEVFLDIFRNSIDLKSRSRLEFNGQSYKAYIGNEAPEYSGVIMLMHAGVFRGEGRDFIYCLEPVIKHLKGLGYNFGTCDVFLHGMLKIRGNGDTG
jgi:peptidoglycan/xylan/chitin deacetylase (PgdA/CDA1 family)